ncbi:MAG: tRNA pseudouridine(55) synthase TruB [Oligoflexia bacterium]|nr:tRNA pseudouridine(55) synthase TruB [Oligoflexia bacterium]
MSFHGVLLVDKEAGMTSHDVVQRLRKITGESAIGHAGTLDPMATGLLVCLIGEATKLSQYVMNEHKVYWVQAKLGELTDTGDITGQVMEKKSADHVTLEMVTEMSQKLVGALELPVPIYSAVKINGKKLYEYARSGEAVDLPVKHMQIKSAVVHGFENGVVTFTLECEKGTYVRSWVEKLGSLLGCGATVQALRRVRAGDFVVEEARRLDQLTHEQGWEKALRPMAQALGHWPMLKVVGRDGSLVKHGQIPKGIYAQLSRFEFQEGIKLIDDKEALLALVIADQKRIPKLARVFNTKR